MRKINLTAPNLDQLACGHTVDVTDQDGKAAKVDGSKLSTAAISALCDGGKSFASSSDGSDMVLMGVDLS